LFAKKISQHFFLAKLAIDLQENLGEGRNVIEMVFGGVFNFCKYQVSSFQ
jgi:hypothetical protein